MEAPFQPGRGSGGEGRGTRGALSCCVMLALGLGCASNFGIYTKLDRRVESGRFAAAAELLEENQRRLYGKRNAFLYHLELGMLLHLAGDYVESNLLFEEAKQIGDALFTKSVSSHAASFLLNERVRAYHGENFERALIHVFSALNYELMGDSEGAVVEARQVDALLTKLETDLGQKNVYREDAFARYLSAMLFESRGRWSDAIVAYRKALEAYQVYQRDYGVTIPGSLLPAALAAARRQGAGAVRKLRERWGDAEPRRLDPGRGEVVVLHYNGWVPRKAERFFEISFGDGWAYVDSMKPRDEEQAKVDTALAVVRSVAADEMMRIAFPTYQPTPYIISLMDVTAESATEITPAELVEDIGAIAVKDLEDRAARVRTKAIARAAVKYATAKGVCEAAKELHSVVEFFVCGAAQASRIASERADTRAWRNVPDQIWMSSASMPPGEHAVSVNFRDSEGRLVAQQTIEAVHIEAGRRTFVIVRTVR